MLYSIGPASLLIINLILNWESFKKYGFYAKTQDKKNKVSIRYNHFILAASFYIIIDMTWGLLYEHRDIPELFPFIYSLTVFYFMFMLFTIYTWTRYIVAYLDKRGLRSSVLLYGVRTNVVIGILCLVLNRYYHFMFSYNDAHEFIGETGNNVSFLLQLAFYAVVSVYMLFVANKSSGRQKFRYKTVAVTSLVLGVSLLFQTFFAMLPFYATGLMIGISLVHSFVQSNEKKEKEIHDNIASTMAEDYEAIFYIEIESGEYLTFSKSKKYDALNVTAQGIDFFAETMENLEKCVYPDDLEYAKSLYNKETMLNKLEGRRSFSFKHRLLINGEPRFFLFTVMRENTTQYLVFFAKDIEDELNAEKIRIENQKKTITFEQIAVGLASNYDVVYYVDVADSSYFGYEVNNIYGQLDISNTGDDFFKSCNTNIPLIVHKQDREQVTDFINKDHIISMLENHKDISIKYRIKAADKYRYTRMSIRKTSDGTHFIVTVENIDDEIQKEAQHLKALKSEKELARRDELTGIKNKTAYKELEESVQGNMDNAIDYLNFGLVVCDTNNLKKINDTQGHAAGDEYIKASARILCDIFVHSPVFRVGGDEFVVFLRGNDYSSRHELMDKLRSQVLENKKMGAGVILASGMSEYKPESDTFVSDIFERADKEMYEDKQRLKAM